MVCCSLWKMPLYICERVRWKKRLSQHVMTLGTPLPRTPVSPSIPGSLAEKGFFSPLKGPSCPLISHSCSHQDHLEIPLKLTAGPTPGCLVSLGWVGLIRKVFLTNSGDAAAVGPGVSLREPLSYSVENVCISLKIPPPPVLLYFNIALFLTAVFISTH